MKSKKSFEKLFENRPKTWYNVIGDEVRNVWNPELVFQYVQDTKTLPRYGTDAKFGFWFNTKKNIIEYIEYIRVTFSCDFEFGNYPFDENTCEFFFAIDNTGGKKGIFKPIKILKVGGSPYGDLFEGKMKVQNKHLPFDIHLEATKNFSEYTNYLYTSPFTGL